MIAINGGKPAYVYVDGNNGVYHLLKQCAKLSDEHRLITRVQSRKENRYGCRLCEQTVKERGYR